MEETRRQEMTRRDWLRWTGAGAAGLAATAIPGLAATRPQPGMGAALAQDQEVEESEAVKQDRIRRMQWWHAARFGMFIHFGLYSVLGRHEWAMEMEGIPVKEYEKLAKVFNPKP